MRHLLTPPAALRDLALLATRLLLGTVLIAHGWQKFTQWGLDGTAASFEKMGAPMPGLSSALAAVIELGGGILILLGALTPVVALLVALNMAGAYLIAHAGHGIFASDGGWELVGMIAAAALALVGAGAGRISLDGLLGRNRGTATRLDSHSTGATSVRRDELAGV